jgi:hypothetical protein
MGHTAGIHTGSRDLARAYGTEMPASRVVVNTPTTHGAIGFSTALPPSMTLGCGSWGGNVTSDNISPWHLMDIKRVAFETRAVPSKRPAARAAQTASTPLQPAPATAARTGATAGNVSRDDIAKMVDRFLSGRQEGQPATSPSSPSMPAAPPMTGAPLHASRSHAFVQADVDIEPHRVSPSGGVSPQPEAAPNVEAANGGNGSARASVRETTAQTSAPAPSTPAPQPAGKPASGNGQTGGGNGHKVVDFVCEDDVRRAIQKGEKIYTNARTIITPAARDMGDAAEVFAKG